MSHLRAGCILQVLDPLLLQCVFRRLLAPWNSLPEGFLGLQNVENAPSYGSFLELRALKERTLTRCSQNLLDQRRQLLHVMCICAHKCACGSQYHSGKLFWGMFFWEHCFSGLPKLQDVLCGSPLGRQPQKLDASLGARHCYYGSTKEGVVDLSLRHWDFEQRDGATDEGWVQVTRSQWQPHLQSNVLCNQALGTIHWIIKRQLSSPDRNFH